MLAAVSLVQLVVSGPISGHLNPGGEILRVFQNSCVTGVRHLPVRAQMAS